MFSENPFADPKPDVMDLRGEPRPCEVCGCDASEYPCDRGVFCEDCHTDIGISGCRSDDCWGV
jgi:hypothetical protein